MSDPLQQPILEPNPTGAAAHNADNIEAGFCGCCFTSDVGGQQSRPTTAHIDEEGAYTTCVIFQFPDESDAAFQEHSHQIGLAMRRLVASVAPDGQGEPKEKDKGRVILLESGEAMSLADVLGGQWGCWSWLVDWQKAKPNREDHHDNGGSRDAAQNQENDRKVCVLLRASHVALQRMELRQQARRAMQAGKRAPGRSSVWAQEKRYCHPDPTAL